MFKAIINGLVTGENSFDPNQLIASGYRISVPDVRYLVEQYADQFLEEAGANDRAVALSEGVTSKLLPVLDWILQENKQIIADADILDYVIHRSPLLPHRSTVAIINKLFACLYQRGVDFNFYSVDRCREQPANLAAKQRKFYLLGYLHDYGAGFSRVGKDGANVVDLLHAANRPDQANDICQKYGVADRRSKGKQIEKGLQQEAEFKLGQSAQLVSNSRSANTHSLHEMELLRGAPTLFGDSIPVRISEKGLTDPNELVDGKTALYREIFAYIAGNRPDLDAIRALCYFGGNFSLHPADGPSIVSHLLSVTDDRRKALLEDLFILNSIYSTCSPQEIRGVVDYTQAQARLAAQADQKEEAKRLSELGIFKRKLDDEAELGSLTDIKKKLKNRDPNLDKKSFDFLSFTIRQIVAAEKTKKSTLIRNKEEVIRKKPNGHLLLGLFDDVLSELQQKEELEESEVTESASAKNP